MHENIDEFTLKNYVTTNGYISHLNYADWGHSILIMEKSGGAFCRIYRYNDDNTTVYLDFLSVDDKLRNKGIGTELQELREKIGRDLGAKTSCLWVDKNTWMYEWYKRRGYIDFKDHDDENYIWMQKSL